MHISRNTLLGAALLTIGLTQVALSAPVIYQRTSLSPTGFSTRAAAESWYPQEIWFDINGSEARGTYGEATMEPEGTRQILTFEAQNTYVKIRFFPDQMRASVWLVGSPRYSMVVPAGYRCVPA